jgi:feruloyl esterase
LPDAQKARAIDLIWDGPRHANGNRIWYPQQRGTALQGLSGNPPFGLTPPLLRWNENSTTFDWHTVTLYGASGTQSYAQLAMDGSTAPFDGPSFSVADEVDTDGNLDIFIGSRRQVADVRRRSRPT